MATEVEEMRHKLTVVRKERIDFAASFDAENAPTEDDERKLDAMINGEADLEAEVTRTEKFAKSSATGGRADPDHPNPAKTDGRAPVVSLGQRFVDSEEFKAALANYAPEGRIPEAGKFQMPGYAFKGLGELGLMANLITGDSATSAGAFVVADRFPELQTIGRKPLRIFDIIRRLSTSSDLVEYVAQTSRTNAAATRPEATGSGDGTGSAAESAMAFVVRNTAVYDIANWIPVTKQAVADVPQMQGIVDTELKDNVEETLADKIVNGSGSSDIPGILNTSGTQTQAWDTNILTTTRKAKTLVSTVGRRVANAYVLNPTDWETIDLLQDSEARYYYGGPAQVGIPRLWGLPVVEEEAVTAGGGMTGDFQKCTLWDRQQSSLSISDSHADFFTRGLLAMLANLRAAFALTQPNAIVEIDTAA